MCDLNKILVSSWHKKSQSQSLFLLTKLSLFLCRFGNYQQHTLPTRGLKNKQTPADNREKLLVEIKKSRFKQTSPTVYVLKKRVQELNSVKLKI